MWLVGMMGAGKTSVGRMAAGQLGVEFGDTDEFVAGRMGCSVAQLWGSVGEAVFRDMEKVAVANLAGLEGIVATGGGVVLEDDSRNTITESPKVVWLQASPQRLSERLEDTADRPLLTDIDSRKALSDLLSERSDLYDEMATHRIATDTMGESEVVEQVVGIWNS